ncbi:MAG TPA: hypothetical protein VNI01_11220 [Elusimicrobiota bacterium]|nr:hypothetical protein [Elusimicrobiota bacterium]
MSAKQNYTVSRYEGSVNWSAAIQPDDRRWIVYVDAKGDAHLYNRVEDVDDAATGAILERYVYAGGPPAPAAPGAMRIVVGPTNPGSIDAYVARTDTGPGRAAGGATGREAVIALLDYLATSGDAGGLALAL